MALKGLKAGGTKGTMPRATRGGMVGGRHPMKGAVMPHNTKNTSGNRIVGKKGKF